MEGKFPSMDYSCYRNWSQLWRRALVGSRVKPHLPYQLVPLGWFICDFYSHWLLWFFSAAWTPSWRRLGPGGFVRNICDTRSGRVYDVIKWRNVIDIVVDIHRLTILFTVRGGVILVWYELSFSLSEKKEELDKQEEYKEHHDPRRSHWTLLIQNLIPFLIYLIHYFIFTFKCRSRNTWWREGGRGRGKIESRPTHIPLSSLHLRFTNKMSQLIGIYQHLSVSQALGKSLLW